MAYQVRPLDPVAAGKPVVTIGIFDTRVLAFLEPNGFRGWTGDFRQDFYLAPDEATPGYRRGPLPAGQLQQAHAGLKGAVGHVAAASASGGAEVLQPDDAFAKGSNVPGESRDIGVAP